MPFVLMYDNFCIVGFKGLDEEATMEALIMADVDVNDIELEDDMIIIYGDPSDLFKIKEAITSALANVNFEIDEIAMVPKETITIGGEDMETFNKVLNMLEDVEDVQHVYHNVNTEE